MYSLLSDLFSDKHGSTLFTCFDIWHFGYIALFVLIGAFAVWFLRKKGTDVRIKTIRFFVHLAFALYLADFFIMPLAYGEINIEKLPFHVCTTMCVMCFLSNHVSFFAKFKWHFALLGFLSNLIYLLYPAGVMWYQIHPLSYRVIQTLVFHGVMAVYGLLVLIYESEHVSFRKWYTDLLVLCAMTAWAMLGNFIYNGTQGNYSHFFNWFFVVRDPFYWFPEDVSPFIMPPLNIALFFSVEMIVYWIIIHAKRTFAKKECIQ